MDLRVSSQKPGPPAPSNCLSDPEEKEVSDDDDDDRNHKHRRREARSQSLERDVSEPVISRPLRKRNKTFGNRHHFREGESQAYEMLNATTEREFSFKFDKRRPGLNSVSRAPMDLSQRLRANQSFPGHPGAGRGRGRDSGSWNQHISRLKSIDVASQMVQQRSIPSTLYTGRGVPNVSNAQSASWNAFGLIPGVPNGGLDMLHPIGLQGTLRPPINASLSMNIPRQRCRDFEEQGFCLRGDMCPMEHGVNRIVVEDVQSLSQFNLPVTLPRAPPGTGSLNSLSASTISMNSKGIHGKLSKSGIVDDSLALGGAYSGPGCTSGADLYDPDQPLWNDSGPETSNALVTLDSSKIDEAEPLSSDAPSEWHHERLSNAPDNDCPIGTPRTSASSQNATSSVWARIGSTKSRSTSFLQHPENQVKEDDDNGELAGVQSGSRQGKRIITEDDGLTDSSLKAQSDNVRNIRKPSQKALRTLFVNGIPQKSNKREALLSHFQKFGEVIDIHIPLNSGRAFVQFSKREEAEAALKAPDAVMGNRFIRLWWANRDSIPDDGYSSSNSVAGTPRGSLPPFVPSHPVVNYRGKDQAASKTVSDISPASDQPKPVMANGPKVHDPPSQKKLENLEQLKEELRKKQEMLDQKRNEFRRQLDKLEKQATGLKSEAVTEQATKRLKIGSEADGAKLASPHSSDSGIGMTSPCVETMADKGKPLVTTVSQSPKASATMGYQESRIVKQPILLLAPVNRYKLDNRPTAFRIIPPLPAGLADAAVLKEHFSPYGEISAVGLEDVGVHDSSQLEARISFTTRHAAERAFINGKCWKNHDMKFMWMTSSNFNNDSGSREQSPSVPKEVLYKDHQVEDVENCVTQEAIVSGDEGPIDSEFKNGLENTSSGEDLQCSPKHISSAKQSPDCNIH